MSDTDNSVEPINEPQPLFGCMANGCAQEVSYPASELRMFRGYVWCEGCWDAELQQEGEPDHFYDLPEFIPAATRRIAELESRPPSEPNSVVITDEMVEQIMDAAYGKCCCSMCYGDDLEGPFCHRCDGEDCRDRVEATLKSLIASSPDTEEQHNVSEMQPRDTRTVELPVLDEVLRLANQGYGDHVDAPGCCYDIASLVTEIFNGHHHPKPPTDSGSTSIVMDKAVADDLIRDICESDEMSPDDPQAVCVSYEALRTIVYRALYTTEGDGR